jgi:hypothetical protein
MSPVSLPNHSIARASVNPIRFYDSRNVRHLDQWSRLLRVDRDKLASAVATVRDDEGSVRVQAASHPGLVRIAADVLRTIRGRMIL